MTRYRLQVTGRVQGVGFRWFTCRAARERGLVGWVQNQADGSVLCEVEGPDAALEAFLADLRRGPRGSRVDDVASQQIPEQREPAFAIH